MMRFNKLVSVTVLSFAAISVGARTFAHQPLRVRIRTHPSSSPQAIYWKSQFTTTPT